MSAALESKLTNKKENIKYDSDLERNYYKKQMSSLQNILMQLRKLCNHPYLLLEEMLSIPDNLYDKYLINSCGKLAVLDKLLDHLLQNNSKVSLISITLRYYLIISTTCR